MRPSSRRTVLAEELRPVLRRIAQQLTLLNLVTGLDEFSIEWLGEPGAYRTLAARDPIELRCLVEHLERCLRVLRKSLQQDWRAAFSERDRWIANARLCTVRALLRDLAAWKRRASWIDIGFE